MTGRGCGSSSCWCCSALWCCGDACSIRAGAGGAGRPPVEPKTRIEMHEGMPIRVITDLPYAVSPIIRAEELALDLYIPEGAGAPIIVYLHGGGWIGGNKNGIGPKSLTFASSGLIVASVNCRLAPMRAAPNACTDIAEAIAFIRHLAPEIGGDPDKLVLMGHSAGADLAALTVCDERYLAPHPGQQPPFVGWCSWMDPPITCRG